MPQHAAAQEFFARAFFFLPGGQFLRYYLHHSAHRSAPPPDPRPKAGSLRARDEQYCYQLVQSSKILTGRQSMSIQTELK